MINNTTSRNLYQKPDRPPLLELENQNKKREFKKNANYILLGAWSFQITMLVLPTLGILFIALLGLNDSKYTETVFGAIPPRLYYLMLGGCYALALAVPGIIYLRSRKQTISGNLPFDTVSLNVFVASVFLGMSVCMLANIPSNLVYIYLKGLFRYEMPENTVNGDIVVQALFFVMISAIPAIFEEFMYRGILLGFLRPYGTELAIVASSVIFSLFHGNFVQFPFAFFIGLIMAFLVIKTNNLWIPITIHFVNNGFSASITILNYYMPEQKVNTIQGIFMVSIIALGILSLIYLTLSKKLFLKRSRQNSLEQSVISPEKWSFRPAVSFFLNLGAIIFIITGLILATLNVAAPFIREALQNAK